METRALAPPRVSGGSEGHLVQISTCGDVGVVLMAIDVGGALQEMGFPEDPGGTDVPSGPLSSHPRF